MSNLFGETLVNSIVEDLKQNHDMESTDAEEKKVNDNKSVSDFESSRMGLGGPQED